jgi:DNA-binding LytR/AlgR family response regulator
MLNAIIIEDERPAMEMLIQALTEADSSIQVDAILSSVKESMEYLSSNPKADIIFSDVQLSDGYSFEIFKARPSSIPVVFITGYDEFMMNAFSCNGIDYLLKPVSKKDLQQALYKYRMLERHFSGHNTMLDNLMRHFETRKRSRLIVRKGMEHLTLKLEDVALLYTENKLVYVVDRLGKKYIGDKNLGEMELELDETLFFRANRQYIININFIKGFRPFEKVKLLVEMALPELKHEIIISQENAPQFRQWIYEA